MALCVCSGLIENFNQISEHISQYPITDLHRVFALNKRGFSNRISWYNYENFIIG